MTWAKLLADNRVKRHTTSKAEIDDLRAVVQRDLKDAQIDLLSADRRFATSYNAALQTAHMIIACTGHRLSSIPGHHRVAFECVALAMGPSVNQLMDYFDACRLKRNHIDYDAAHAITDTEVEEIVQKTLEFVQLAEAWIAGTHPALKS